MLIRSQICNCFYNLWQKCYKLLKPLVFNIAIVYIFKNSAIIIGVEIHPPGVDKPFNIKVYVIGCTCDLPARALVLNAMQFNGEYGCSFCEQPGVTTRVGSSTGHVHTFPYNKDNPKGPARTKAGCAHDAMIARSNHSVVKYKFFNYLSILIIICRSMESKDLPG